MPYVLQDVDVAELSLVDKAAIKRKFVLIKSEEGANDMPMTEVILSCDEGREDLLKAVAELTEEEATLLKSLLSDDDVDEIKKAGISEKAMKAVKMALGALKGVKDELPADIMRKLAALGGYSYPEKKAEKPAAPMDEEKDKMKKSFGGYTIIKNEDGSVDFSDIPEEMQPLVKSMWDESEAARKDAEEAKEIAKSEKDARVMREFIAKADDLGNLSTDSVLMGAILKAASETLAADHFEELERVLKSANAAIEESNLLKEAGKDGEGIDEKSAYSKLCKAADVILKEEGSNFPTFEQAYVEATARNPELAAQERAER